MSDINARVLAAFQAEHKEHLEGIRGLLTPARHGDGPLEDSALDEAFRLAHSLKGGARVCDLGVPEKLGHELESLFSRLQHKTIACTPQVVRAVDVVLDAIEDWMSELAEGSQPAVPREAMEALVPLLNGEAKSAPAAVPPEIVESPPTDGQPSRARRESREDPRTLRRDETVRVSAENLDRLLRSSSHLTAETLDQDRVAGDLQRLGDDLRALECEHTAARRALGLELQRAGGDTTSASAYRAFDAVDRRVRGLAAQVRRLRVEHARSLFTLRARGDAIQRDVCEARTIPAESVFQGFRKLVRDLARDLDKQIEFELTGLEVHADRLVLQSLKDPLMHVLRNAVVHGIETPAERAARGKPAAGNMRLTIQTNGNQLHITVTDDGCGIEPRELSEAGTRLGLDPASCSADRPLDELLGLAFQPGFSTSATVSELSGRGMGLSVVREEVHRLQGTASLRSRPGEGTTLEIVVPLSITHTRLLLVRAAERCFAVPLDSIERVMRLAPQDVISIEGQPAALIEGIALKLVWLSDLLGSERTTTDEAPLSVLVFRRGGERGALVVDDFVNERRMLVRPLTGPAADVPLASGGVILEDDSVALVLRPGEWLERRQTPTFATPGTIAKSTVQPTVLVVDDSFTARTLEKAILETHGYQVLTAADGAEGLAVLRDHRVDVVLTDLEMPRLDGLGMLERIRADATSHDVPVVVITSVDRDDARQRSTALGASAYIVKRAFDQEDLLDIIRCVHAAPAERMLA